MTSRIDELLAAKCPNAQQRALLVLYGEMLLARNASVNLTGARDAQTVAAHILDALTIARFIEGSLVDVGSGGGLPGIPLAIACSVPVTLIEATAKKARFLEQTLSTLNISGEVVVTRAEEAAHEPRYRERFLCATARAVGALPTVLELTLPFLEVGGRAVLQRGALDDAQRRDATHAATVLGGEVVAEDLVAPARCVVVVEKRDATPASYPRKPGTPAKRPLRTVSGRSAA